MSGAPDHLERRVQRLEDHAAIVALKHAYCAACDADYDAQAIADLFTGEALWDGGVLGRAEGREAILAYFGAAARRAPFALHYVTNGSVFVSGEKASCSWYLWQPMVMRGVDDALWYAARYDDVCVRTSEGWRFLSMRLTTRLLTPYADGFRKTPILDLAARARSKVRG